MLTLTFAMVVAQLHLPSVTMEVGQTRRVSLPSQVQRLTVSGVSLYDARFPEPGVMELVAYSPGRTTVLLWLVDGRRATFDLRIDPAAAKAKPVKVVRTELQGVTVFELPEQLTEVTEVIELDGGVRLVGRTARGARLEIDLAPKR